VAPYTKATLLGCAGVVCFDAVASVASLALGFPYGFAAIGSFLIYVVVGAAAVRHSSVGGAATAGAFVGLADATVGWAVSWLIGPGRAPPGGLQLSRAVGTVVAVSLLAGLAAGIGGALNQKARRPPMAAA